MKDLLRFMNRSFAIEDWENDCTRTLVGTLHGSNGRTRVSFTNISS